MNLACEFDGSDLSSTGMMIESIELRWFLETAPFPPSTFFDKSHRSEPSVDWYAYPCGEQYSVKLRDNRLETKLRIATLGTHEFPYAAGRVEHWAKWTANLRDIPYPRDVDLASEGWVAVEKLRYLRVFAIKGSSVREVDSHQEANAQFEWTAVTARDRLWCSIAFDVFGAQKSPLTKLSRLVGFLFRRQLRSSVLAEADSFGYPKLLQAEELRLPPAP